MAVAATAAAVVGARSRVKSIPVQRNQPKPLGVRSLSRAEQGINTALLVSVAEACRMLAVKHKALYRLMDRGDLAYVHIGRYRRIPLWSLEDVAGVPPTRRTVTVVVQAGRAAGVA